MNPITGLLTALGVLTAVYVGGWMKAMREPRRGAPTGDAHAEDGRFPDIVQLATGAVANFFDTLGIGSFATTTAFFRLRKMVPDRIIPGTLNVGHTLPTIAQAFIYTSVIPVDVLTLFSMIAAAVLGAWLGAGVVAGWPKQKIQLGMGAALLVAATLMLITQVQTMSGSRILPLGGEALGVRGGLLAVAVIGNFALGALMTLGIGLYAPCMILVSLLGMNPTAAFPIMMGSCAFLMPVGSLRFIRERAYSLRAALGLAIGGIPGVLIAAYIVKSLDLGTVRWLVIVVVLYTAVTMLIAASGKTSTSTAPAKA
jgi:uncharacterized membrane protein YfcA